MVAIKLNHLTISPLKNKAMMLAIKGISNNISVNINDKYKS
jgi:hypothetical protein